MGINKFANTPDERPFFHTSGYATAAHGTNLGATSSQSFTDRRHMERNRSSIGRYHDSIVAGAPTQPDKESQTAISPPHDRSRLQVRSRQNPANGVSSAPRQSFTEPPVRKYNPYG